MYAFDQIKELTNQTAKVLTLSEGPREHHADREATLDYKFKAFFVRTFIAMVYELSYVNKIKKHEITD